MTVLPHFPARLGRSRGVLVIAALTIAATLTAAPPGSPVAGRSQMSLMSTSTTSPPPSVPAYWTVASDGGVFAYGGLPFWGSMGGRSLVAPMVGIAPTSTPTGDNGQPGADGSGYWTVASDGGVFAFGSANFWGSMGGKKLVAPMVAVVADPATGGYWTVASDGGVFAFNAPYLGSMGGKKLVAPVVTMAATPDGGGYWLFASDGGVFAFGDANFWGSMGGKPLEKPIVGAVPNREGTGYWLVASDGGIFAFNVPFLGSLGEHQLAHPIVAMSDADDNGYWMTDSNGAVTAFGDAGYFGSAPQNLFAPMVAMADGPGTGMASGNGIYPSGSYGYDLSNFQCGAGFPSGHTIGIVQATGASGAAPNPCLAQEAQWAGAGLNLYMYMTYGDTGPAVSDCSGTYQGQCDFGYAAALYAFNTVKNDDVTPLVTWWLDVESDPSWTQDTASNAAVVQGALDGLHDQGINNVGVYTSPNSWNPLMGDYQPPVPLWIAWWTGNGPANCQNIASYAQSQGDMLPTGPVWVTQYSDDAAQQSNNQPVDGDYAC